MNKETKGQCDHSRWFSWFYFNTPTRFGTTWDQPKWRSQCCALVEVAGAFSWGSCNFPVECWELSVKRVKEEHFLKIFKCAEFRRKGQQLRKHHDSENNFPSSAAESVHMFKSSRSKGYWTQHINTRWKLDRSPKPLKHLTERNQDLVQHLCGEEKCHVKTAWSSNARSSGMIEVAEVSTLQDVHGKVSAH